MRIWITGATGFVGRNFLNFILGRGIAAADIACLIREPERAGFLAEAGCRMFASDLLTPETYRQEIREADFVFHIAARVGLKNGAEFYTANRDGTRALIETLQDSRELKRLVFLSSIAAIDREVPGLPGQLLAPLDETFPARPSTDYGKSKQQAEALLSHSGLPYTILRPTYIYGPYPRKGSSMDRVIEDVLQGKPYTRFPFPGRASGIHAEDLAEALWEIANHPKALNEDFFVSNPEPLRIASFFEHLAQALGTPYDPVQVSESVMKRFYRFQRARHPEDPVISILYTDQFACRAEKLRRLTGYAPRLDYETGIKKTVSWYRKQGLLAKQAPANR